ncbi:MAG: NYN domain-containing protein [Leptospiraceae bacterium]|nr:NYN domain-containing protein [Leptospiraceae bacterium]MCB1319058.1 NYN domain-containing protein [Leptospiraceae bacterium]
MILVIDAFNAIYKFPELEELMYRGELERAIRGLVGLLARVRKHWKKELNLYVFFDGKRKQGDETRQVRENNMELYFSHDLSADYLIMEFIKNYRTPADLKIISSDKQIQDFARRHKCQRQTAEEFAAWVQSVIHPPGEDPGEKEEVSTMDADELAYWQSMFTRRKKSKD